MKYTRISAALRDPALHPTTTLTTTSTGCSAATFSRGIGIGMPDGYSTGLVSAGWRSATEGSSFEAASPCSMR
jgi:hypothetical protein